MVKIKIREFLESKYFLPVLVVVLTLLTHGVNLWGYPSFEGDEGTYTSQGWWLVRFGKLAPYTYWYDHPPFGWLQIGLWQLLTGGPFAFGFSLFSTRLLMLLVAAATNLLVFFLTRSLTKSPKLALLASLFFAFSPLGIFFRRRVLLENLATFWFLLSLYFLWQRPSLTRFWLSGLAFGIAFLSKEVMVVFLPVMIYALWVRSRPENRQFCFLVWLASALFLISLFPLLALLKNEFFPSGWLSSGKHVSLLETIVFQMKRGSGLKPWRAGSQLQASWARWSKIDFLGMSLGLISVLVNLLFGRKFSASRIFALFSLTFLLFLARGGLVSDFYILPLLTLLAVDLALAVKALVAKWPGLVNLVPARVWIYGLCLLPGLLISQHLELFTGRVTASQLAAVSFVKQTVPQDAVIAVDDFALIDFKLGGEDGYRFANAEWFSKLENDPEIRDGRLGNRWERVDYLLLSHEFLRNLGEGNLPFLEKAYDHSFLVKDFPPGLETVRDLGSFYSTGGDWATLLGVAPSREGKLLAGALFGDLLASENLSARSEEKVVIGLDQAGIKVPDQEEIVVAESGTKAILARMSLEEKIGQLFLVGFDGQELTPETKAFLSDHFLGGVLLLGKNVANQDQLAGLTESLAGVGKEYPFLIALDQEGGRVARVNLLGIDQVSQGEIKSVEQAYLLAQKRGESLARLGIRLNLAPVLDVVRDNFSFINLDRRSFGDSEEWVSRLGLAMIKGYQEAGVLTVPKHYPGGLGRTTTDPHQQLPVIDVDKRELEKDLWPFSEAIKAGAPAIMVSHLLYPQIDDTFPTSLSSKFITNILRENLGFDGLVVVDDLKMGALKEWYSVEETVKYSFRAGADVFIISGGQEDQIRAINALVNAVRSGEITEERLDQSVERVLRFKGMSYLDD